MADADVCRVFIARWRDDGRCRPLAIIYQREMINFGEAIRFEARISVGNAKIWQFENIMQRHTLRFIYAVSMLPSADRAS